MISVFCKHTGTNTAYKGVQYNLSDFAGDGWRYFEGRSQKTISKPSHPTLTFESISCFLIGGEDFYIDDIVASDGALGKAYHLIPGGSAAGYLGCEDGITRTQYTTPDPDEYNVTQGDQWYYQYNDLGDVLAWTDEDGVKLAAATPDFFGNYWTISGTIPEGNDHLGKTSKFIDSGTGLYYFDARCMIRKEGHSTVQHPIDLT